ncbi:unnamed protein product [Phytophthora lilii]|uniref:Unnamed protein product n=1 Tax=Phytophthora lilii TaxID=2077276 RepID=A0A9W6WQP1_9STRA|nr:unnamed protein product [Phytophthora lilii]
MGYNSSTTFGIRFEAYDCTFTFAAYAPCYGGSYTNASDVRLKKDIIDMRYGLDTVLRMKPREFKFKYDNKPYVGFIAQEMAQCVPEVVNAPEDPEETWGIDYASLVSVLCKAIQKLMQEVDELRAIISECV